MGYAYEDYCEDVRERDHCTDYHYCSQCMKSVDKIARVQYWAQAVDDELRNPENVDIALVDRALEELFHLLDMPISEKPLNVISHPQLMQVK